MLQSGGIHTNSSSFIGHTLRVQVRRHQKFKLRSGTILTKNAMLKNTAKEYDMDPLGYAAAYHSSPSTPEVGDPYPKGPSTYK